MSEIKPYWFADENGLPDAYLVTGEAAQDIRDGEALRKLREALPDERMFVLSMGPIDDRSFFREEPLPPYSVRVCASSRVVLLEGRGATIAEAADKCREALG